VKYPDEGLGKILTEFAIEDSFIPDDGALQPTEDSKLALSVIKLHPFYLFDQV
jgi:hypothetical protein